MVLHEVLQFTKVGLISPKILIAFLNETEIKLLIFAKRSVMQKKIYGTK